MSNDSDSLYVDAEQVMKDWGVSRATAYTLIKRMNEQIKRAYPSALIIAGKVNRLWYNEACLRRSGGISDE